MFEALIIGGLASWGVVDGSPKLLEWLLKLENKAKQEEQAKIDESMEIYFDDHIVSSGQTPVPKVIVIPIGEETKRERLVITK
jgi:hypothetical protein